jgi:hypothetical protein
MSFPNKEPTFTYLPTLKPLLSLSSKLQYYFTQYLVLCCRVVVDNVLVPVYVI